MNQCIMPVITVNSKRKETKRERFVRLATKRTNEVLDKLRILGGCANRRMYEYADPDVKKVFKVIEAEVKKVKSYFEENKKTEFRLEV